MKSVILTLYGVWVITFILYLSILAMGKKLLLRGIRLGKFDIELIFLFYSMILFFSWGFISLSYNFFCNLKHIINWVNIL